MSPQCAMAGRCDWRLRGGHLQTTQGRLLRLWSHPGPWSIRLNSGLLQGGASPQCGWSAQLNPRLPSGTTAVHFISVWSVGRFHQDMRPRSEPTGLRTSPLSATRVLSLDKAPAPPGPLSHCLTHLGSVYMSGSSLSSPTASTQLGQEVTFL